MKTKTWWRVNKEGSWVGTEQAIAWTDTTISIACPGLPGCYKTHLIRSSDGDNYFETEQEAIEYSHRVVGKLITWRMKWA